MPNVNVTYHEVRAASGRLIQAHSEIDTKLSELVNMITSLVQGGYVTDRSSTAFHDSYSSFHEGARKVVEGLEGMGRYLDSAATTFEQADQDLAGKVGGMGMGMTGKMGAI